MERVFIRCKLILCLVAISSAAFAQQAPPKQTDLPFVPGKRWAIVIGASGYEHYERLKFASKDADSLASLLINDYRFEPGTVKLLTDSPDSKEKPTAGNILGEVEEILASKTLDKSDLFIFYFSGHGIGTDKGDFLLPTDARPASAERVGLPISEVIDRFTKAGLKNVLVVVDACRAGKENPFGVELERLGREAHIAVLLGCEPGGRSYEEPRLGHGIFTYELLETLRDKKLRDANSGALWASVVANSVKERTHDYTERDFGTSAQVPKTWSSKTEDVLLGAYVPDTSNPDLVKAFKEKASELTPKYYASAMAQFAEGLFHSDRFAECVEVLKTLEQLNELGPASAYLLGTTLQIMDRTLEAKKVYEKLTNDQSASFYKDLALATTSAKFASPDAKLKSARALWALDNSWNTGFLVWSIIKVYGARAEKESFLNAFIPTPDLTPRQAEYLKSELAAVQFRWKDSVSGFRRAVAIEGVTPTTDFLCRLQVPLLEIAEPSGMDALIDERTKSDKASYWYLLRANRLKERGDKTGSMAALKAALSSGPSPDDLLNILECAGINAISIADDVAKEADKYPYTWRAQLARTMSSAKSGVDKLIAAIKDAERYADDLVAFKTAAATIFDSFLSELTEQGLMKPEVYVGFSDSMFVGLAASSEDFGLNGAAWWEVAVLGAKSERFWQIAKLAERLLKPATATNIDLTLCSTLMIIFASVGDNATTAALNKSALTGGVDSADAIRFYAVCLATQGKFADAEKAMASIGSSTAIVDDSYLAFRAWLDAAQGRKKDAEAKLAKVKGVEFYGRAFMGLAYAALGNMEKAAPLLDESRSKRSWGYIYVHAKAVSILDEHLRNKKDFKTTDQIAFEAAISQVGNPLYAKFHYGETAGIKNFVGDYSWKVHGYTDEYTSASGDLSLKVESNGAASGFFEDTEKHTYRISGEVDEFGNLKGSVTGEGKEWSIDSKLAPPKYYETFESLRTTGQYFMLLDGKQRRIAWLAMPVK